MYSLAAESVSLWRQALGFQMFIPGPVSLPLFLLPMGLDVELSESFFCTMSSCFLYHVSCHTDKSCRPPPVKCLKSCHGQVSLHSNRTLTETTSSLNIRRIFLFFKTEFLLCGPGCPGTHSVGQAGLELRDSPASAS